nr:MAG TPA: hypothetical protein [Caudoviricetes sp.]
MATTKTDETKPKMVKVKLRKDREHQDDVTVGLNGEMFRIKRGVEVEVPEGVKEILDNTERMDELALERSMALAAETELTQ